MYRKNAWKNYDEAERARDHLTPVFMVCAEKGVV